MKLREYKVRNLLMLAQLQEELSKKHGEEARETVRKLIKKTYTLSLANLVDYIATIIASAEKYRELIVLLPSFSEVEEIFREESTKEQKEKKVSPKKEERAPIVQSQQSPQPPSQPQPPKLEEEQLVKQFLNEVEVRPPREGVRVGWDKRVDYEQMYNTLARAIITEDQKGKCYAAVALTVLTNGLVPREGAAAIIAAIKLNTDVVEVRRRWRRELSFKKVRIPHIVKPVLPLCKEELQDVDDLHLMKRVQMWMHSRYGINLYSLRFAFLRHSLESRLKSSLEGRSLKEQAHQV